MKTKLFTVIKTLLVVTTLGCIASVLWAGFHYLHTDPRFNVRQITVAGQTRVSEDDVTSRIQLRTDSHTNIFAVNMDDVRTHVEQIQWVKYATVQRILPDRIMISVVERTPVGLANIDGHYYEFDRDGAVLEPEASPEEHFPILVGMSANDNEGNLRKIETYLKVREDLGSSKLSEITVSSNNEVSVVRDDDPLIVNLGVDNFKERWSKYLSVKMKIDDEYKDAVRVDLRFRNKVIVSMQDDDDGGKVIWDGKKKSL